MLDVLRPVPKKRTVRLKTKKGVLFKSLSHGERLVFYLSSLFVGVGVIYGAYLYQPLAWVVGIYIMHTVAPEAVSAPQLAKTGYLPLPPPTTMPVLPVATSAPLATPTPFDTTFKIRIAKIVASADVVENVDTQSKVAYTEALKNDRIAHALGSNLPGEGKNTMIYLFAHSSEQSISAIRKNAVFYLLDTLKNGDEIEINYHGTYAKYRMFDRKVISAGDTTYFGYKDPSKEVLILQTCWPLGTNWKRLLVLAERV